jgi:hypothetical protein
MLREHKIHRQGSCFNSELDRLSKRTVSIPEDENRSSHHPDRNPSLQRACPTLTGCRKERLPFQKTRTEAPITRIGIHPSQQACRRS